MAQKQRKNSDELDIQNLETRVDELIKTCDRLKDENHSLRNNQESLVSERAKLIEKTEMARSRVEAMILRLKTMGQDA